MLLAYRMASDSGQGLRQTILLQESYFAYPVHSLMAPDDPIQCSRNQRAYGIGRGLRAEPAVLQANP